MSLVLLQGVPLHEDKKDYDDNSFRQNTSDDDNNDNFKQDPDEDLAMKELESAESGDEEALVAAARRLRHSRSTRLGLVKTRKPGKDRQTLTRPSLSECVPQHTGRRAVGDLAAAQRIGT
mmetsp:Transcript_72367/g.182559  ORF Transcript_72367/g.182559 Transcript_72367/m.182559 type:complete len:120 (+) Transcript_72367:977-1336(+)